MIERGTGGAIVNLSSTAALAKPGPLLHYGSAKAALIAYGAGLAKELGPAGIRVNTVTPGNVTTAGGNEVRVALAERFGIPVEAINTGNPLGRIGVAVRAGRAGRLPRLRPRLVRHRRELRRRRRGDRLASRHAMARPREFDEETVVARRPRPLLGRGLRGHVDDRPLRGHRARQDEPLRRVRRQARALPADLRRVLDRRRGAPRGPSSPKGPTRARSSASAPTCSPTPAARPATRAAACSPAARPSWRASTRRSPRGPSRPTRSSARVFAQRRRGRPARRATSTRRPTRARSAT